MMRPIVIKKGIGDMRAGSTELVLARCDEDGVEERVFTALPSLELSLAVEWGFLPLLCTGYDWN